jgi:hypothetical protein
LANELLFAFPQRHLSDGCESAALALKMSFGRNEVSRVIALDQAANVGDRPFHRVMPVTAGHLVKHDLAIFQGNAGEMLRDGLLFSGMHATGPYQIRRLERDNRAINFGAVVRLSRALPLRIRPYILSHHHSGSRFIDDADVEWRRCGSRLIGSACSRRCIRTCSRIRARVGNVRFPPTTMYETRQLQCTFLSFQFRRLGEIGEGLSHIDPVGNRDCACQKRSNAIPDTRRGGVADPDVELSIDCRVTSARSSPASGFGHAKDRFLWYVAW